MPSLQSPDSSDGRSANGSESDESADLNGDHNGVREDVPALDAHAHSLQGAAAPQSPLADGEQGGITPTTTERVGRGRMLRATAMSGVFRSSFSDERLRGDTPPATVNAQGERPESFLNPVSLEFIQIGRELFQLGREQRRIEQEERRLIDRAMELLRTNQWLRDEGQESEVSDEEE
ncbi:hypothetical protein PENSPDRAFT_659339 [Peniophora sp. CONT]|nr:hypothetical protein PENSPDRAFT_659339 [Peniophora sp. CONT]